MGKVRAQRVCAFLVGLFILWIPLFGQDFSSQIDKYKKELRENPDNIDAMIQLARNLSWSGRLDESVDQYKEVLKRNPDNIEAQIGLATVYSWQKKYSESTRMLKKILEKYPDNTDALVSLGRVYSWQGEYQKSIQIFQDAMKRSPEDREILIGLGRVYGWNKQYGLSEQMYQKILSKKPKDLETLRGLANTYKWAEQYTKGIHTELQILEMEPNDVDSMLSIGYMYGQLGAMGQSIHWYEKASKIAPTRADIQAHLGILYSHNAQVDSAANAFKKAISLEERDIENYISLGRVYGWQNKMDDAEKLFKKAIEINPQSAGAYSGLAQLYFFNGQWEESIVNYKKSLRIDPYYIEALQGLKRVSLLKAPSYTFRYNLFVSNYMDAFTRNPTVKEYQHIFSHEFTYKFSPSKLIEVRYFEDQYAQRDLDTGFRDYLFSEKIMSGKFDFPILPKLLKNRLVFSGRYDQEFFERIGNRHTYNLVHDEWFPGGYSLLRYEQGPFLSVASYSREPHIRQGSGMVDIDHLDTWGGSVNYDFNESLSWIGNFFFNDYQKPTRDRRDWRTILNYRLPFFKPLELGYEFRYRDRPEVLTNSATFRLTDRYLKDKLLLEGLYRLDNDNQSENFGMTHKHVFEAFASYPIVDWITLNTDVTFQLQTGTDRDNFKVFRNYITFLLDWDAIHGRYYKD